MTTTSPPATAIALILDGLPAARWRYIPDGGWLEVFLPGSEGRGGIAEPIGDDLEIRFDVETGQPLSIIIPGYPGWLAEQDGQPPPLPGAPVDYAQARKCLERVLRASPDLAGR